MIFDDIYGNSDIKSMLLNIINNGNVPHALLFYGADGIGKRKMAEAFSCSYMNLSEIKDYPDIYKYYLGSNKKSIGVEDIRAIIEETNKKPFLSDKKIIIIDEFHKATESAQNAFLKTLEEPNKNITIILIANNERDILDTIRSRCQVFNFKPLNEIELRLFLKKEIKNVDENKIDVSITLSQGVPKRAKMFLEDDLFIALREYALEILNLKELSFDSSLKFNKILEKYKNSWEDLLIFMLSYIRDILFFKQNLGSEDLINKDKQDKIYDLSLRYETIELFSLIKNINKAIQMLKSNVNNILALEHFIIFSKGGT